MEAGERRVKGRDGCREGGDGREGSEARSEVRH